MEKVKLTEIGTKIVAVAEAVIGAVLIFILFLGILYLLTQIFYGLGKHYFYLTSKELHKLLDIALILFIIIELFRITLAYLLGKEVIKSVIEAALVAVGRKIVLYEFPQYGIFGALSLTFLTLALVFAYYVVGVKTRKAMKEKSNQKAS